MYLYLVANLRSTFFSLNPSAYPLKLLVSHLVSKATSDVVGLRASVLLGVMGLEKLIPLFDFPAD